MSFTVSEHFTGFQVRFYAPSSILFWPSQVRLQKQEEKYLPPLPHDHKNPSLTRRICKAIPYQWEGIKTGH